MKTSSTKNSLIIGLSIVLGASLLSVGVSSAASSTIKACAKKSTGAMRLIDSSKKCKSSERTLTWGAKGTTGAKGVRGAAGSNGISSTYVFTNTQKTFQQSFPAVEVISTVDLPAGNYTWSHSMEVSFMNPATGGSATLNPEQNYLACWIAKTNSPNYLPADAFWPDSSYNAPFRISFPDVEPSDNENSQSFAVSGVFQLSQQTDLHMMCVYEGGSLENDTDRLMNLRYPTMTLTKVNELVRGK